MDGRDLPRSVSVLDEAWSRQEAWAETATREKATLDRFRLLALVLLVVAAILGASSAAVSALADSTISATWLSGTAALCLVLAGAFQGAFLSDTRAMAWTMSRGASETLKANVYRYLMHHPPFAGEGRDDKLLDITRDLDSRNLPFVRREERPALTQPPPGVTDAESYIDLRLQNQADWHRRRSADHARHARHFHIVVIVMSGAGAIVSVIAMVTTPTVAAAVPALSAGAAAVSAHMGVTQHERLSRTYSATTAQLELELTRYRSRLPTPETEIVMVEATERILALQNENWASLMEPD